VKKDALILSLQARVSHLELQLRVHDQREERRALEDLLHRTVSALEELDGCDLKRQVVTPLTSAILTGGAALRGSLALYLDGGNA
jgi:hypothetical protein